MANDDCGGAAVINLLDVLNCEPIANSNTRALTPHCKPVYSWSVTTMVQLAIVVAALAAIGVDAAATPRARTLYQVKETHSIPRKWQKRDRAPESHVIDLQIGVRQSNFEELEKRLFEGKTWFENSALGRIENIDLTHSSLSP